MGTNTPSRSDALWPWYILTAIYLGFGALVLYDRWGEVGSLFETPTSGRLPLNSIGDILAGFFAPLAFLWLFIATQLQRKELKLQREELAETREVLDDQRLELERSARESNQQTSIMQRTLESSLINVAYEEFGIKLYFLARVCERASDRPLYFSNKDTNTNNNFRFLGGTPDNISQNDQSTVDLFFERYRDNTKVITDQFEGGFQISMRVSDFHLIKSTVNHTFNTLEDLLTNKKYTENDLVIARIDGLGLRDLFDRIRFMMLRIQNLKEPVEEM